jgi:hypothetical protein
MDTVALVIVASVALIVVLFASLFGVVYVAGRAGQRAQQSS